MVPISSSKTTTSGNSKMADKYEFYTAGADTSDSVHAATWRAQSFTPQVSHKITHIKFQAWKEGNPPPVTFTIQEADGDGKPIGDILCSHNQDVSGLSTSSPGAWFQVNFDTNPVLQASQQYVCLMSCPAGSGSNRIHPRYDYSGASYPRGARLISTNSGATWTVDTDSDFVFEEYGTDPYSIPTVQTDPADTIDHESAKLHGTLIDDGYQACEVHFQYGKTVGYGTDTEWQEGKVSEDTFEQLITGLDADQLYHFRAQAKNSQGTTSGSDAEFTTSILPPAYGATNKAQITHPALKTVRIIQYGQEVAKFDELSNPDQSYIESGLTIHIPTPATVEVTTLADQTWEFNIPEK